MLSLTCLHMFFWRDERTVHSSAPPSTVQCWQKMLESNRSCKNDQLCWKLQSICLLRMLHLQSSLSWLRTNWETPKIYRKKNIYRAVFALSAKQYMDASLHAVTHSQLSPRLFLHCNRGTYHVFLHQFPFSRCLAIESLFMVTKRSAFASRLAFHHACTVKP